MVFRGSIWLFGHLRHPSKFSENFPRFRSFEETLAQTPPRETTKCSFFVMHSGTIMDRKRPHCSATSAGDQEAIKLMPPPPPPALPVLETEWERKKRISDARRAENAFMEEALRRERAELERVACERTSAAMDQCARSELHAFLEELRLAGRLTADEIVKRLGGTRVHA